MKIETARTYIRQFTPADASAVLAFNGNTQVTKYTGDSNMVTCIEDARNVIFNIWLEEYKEHGYGRWAVVDKKTEQVIGFCGLKYIPEMGIPDVGYRFLPEFWGQGYATETAITAIDYCKSELNIVEFFGDVMEDNIASVKVLKKLGLKFNGYVKEEGLTYMRFMQATPTLLNVNQFYK